MSFLSVRFFIKAVQYSGIPISERITKGKRALPSNGTSKRSEGQARPKSVRQKLVPELDKVPQVHHEKGSALKTVSLPDVGGTLTLTGAFNVFELVGEERKLVFDLVDTMTAFEKKKDNDQPEQK
jgi:hypothetical protein